MTNGKGWMGWMLGILASIVAGLLGILFSLVLRAYDHINTDHVRMFETQDRIMDRLKEVELKRSDCSCY